MPMNPNILFKNRNIINNLTIDQDHNITSLMTLYGLIWSDFITKVLGTYVDRADLTYNQADTIIVYLIEHYGR